MIRLDWINNKEKSDLQINIKSPACSKTFHVSKSILMQGSTYYKRMFSSNMKETTADEINHIFDDGCVNEAGFLLFLQHIYFYAGAPTHKDFEKEICNDSNGFIGDWCKFDKFGLESTENIPEATERLTAGQYAERQKKEWTSFIDFADKNISDAKAAYDKGKKNKYIIKESNDNVTITMDAKAKQTSVKVYDDPDSSFYKIERKKIQKGQKHILDTPDIMCTLCRNVNIGLDTWISLYMICNQLCETELAIHARSYISHCAATLMCLCEIQFSYPVELYVSINRMSIHVMQKNIIHEGFFMSNSYVDSKDNSKVVHDNLLDKSAVGNMSPIYSEYRYSDTYKYGDMLSMTNILHHVYDIHGGNTEQFMILWALASWEALPASNEFVIWREHLQDNINILSSKFPELSPLIRMRKGKDLWMPRLPIELSSISYFQDPDQRRSAYVVCNDATLPASESILRDFEHDETYPFAKNVNKKSNAREELYRAWDAGMEGVFDHKYTIPKRNENDEDEYNDEYEYDYDEERSKDDLSDENQEDSDSEQITTKEVLDRIPSADIAMHITIPSAVHIERQKFTTTTTTTTTIEHKKEEEDKNEFITNNGERAVDYFMNLPTKSHINNHIDYCMTQELISPTSVSVTICMPTFGRMTRKLVKHVNIYGNKFKFEFNHFIIAVSWSSILGIYHPSCCEHMRIGYTSQSSGSMGLGPYRAYVDFILESKNSYTVVEHPHQTTMGRPRIFKEALFMQKTLYPRENEGFGKYAKANEGDAIENHSFMVSLDNSYFCEGITTKDSIPGDWKKCTSIIWFQMVLPINPTKKQLSFPTPVEIGKIIEYDTNGIFITFFINVCIHNQT